MHRPMCHWYHKNTQRKTNFPVECGNEADLKVWKSETWFVYKYFHNSFGQNHGSLKNVCTGPYFRITNRGSPSSAPYPHSTGE